MKLLRLEGADNKPENVTKRKRGRPKGSAKTCRTGYSKRQVSGVSNSFGVQVPLESSSHLHSNVKEPEKFVDSGFPTPQLQCLKEQDVVLPIEQLPEIDVKLLGSECTDNQPENVTKRRKGQPKGSGKMRQTDYSKPQVPGMSFAKGFEDESTTSNTKERTLEGQQDQNMNLEHNEVDISGSCMLSLPSDLQQCRRTGKRKWRCSSIASPGKIYCVKHQLEMDIFNKKRRDERMSHRKKESRLESRFSMDPSGQHQCRRTGRGWRCSDMASPGKLYCEKHQLYQDLYTIKMRERRRKKKCLVTSGCDEMKCSNSDLLTCPEGTREEEEEEEEEEEKERSIEVIQFQCPKRGFGVKRVSSDKGLVESGVIDVRKRNPKRSTQLLSSTVEGQQSVAIILEKPASSTNEGINIEAVNDKLTIEQIDHSQMLCLTMEEHQANNGTEKDTANNDLKIADIDHKQLVNSTLEEDQSLGFCNEMSNLLVVENTKGRGTEEANNNLTISQIEHTQLWSNVLEECRALPSFGEDFDFPIVED